MRRGVHIVSTLFVDAVAEGVTERVNAYDEQHLATYLRLLDADAEGADWREPDRAGQP